MMMMISVKKSVEKGVQKSVRANLLGMWMKVLTATDVGKDLRYNAFSSWPMLITSSAARVHIAQLVHRI